MDFVDPARAFTLELVGGRGHYERVVRAAMEARRSVWIATANLKELMVEDHRAVPGRRRTARAGGGRYRSILEVFDELAGRGVELRILHAGPPSRAFRAAVKNSGRLGKALALRACPRVHFKAVIVDGAFVYVGSANWTGAGLGAKGSGRRNFELGFAGADDALLDRTQEMLDHIWRGAACRGCKLREICPAPLDGLPP
ncbi:MAG TPA: phospholipase D-like domain-containing protein [Polyangia bacterium]|nr:phospholipase D-like domain-containing protein [Polyangia bacterium]